MKAFKQINLKLENQMVFSYAVMLCFLCSFIMLNPLFGQVNDDQDANKPKVQIDVNQEYDENGNVITYDSTYKWFLSGEEVTNMNFDSIFEKFHQDFDHWNDNFERNSGGLWNHLDSSSYADLDDLFDDEFLDQLDFKHDHFDFYDSTITSLFDFDIKGTLWEDFDQNLKMEEFLGNHELFEKLNKDQEDYNEKFREYQKEHQKLIEKYFGEPADKNDPDIKNDQNNFSPGNEKEEPGKTGRI